MLNQTKSKDRGQTNAGNFQFVSASVPLGEEAANKDPSNSRIGLDKFFADVGENSHPAPVVEHLPGKDRPKAKAVTIQQATLPTPRPAPEDGDLVSEAAWLREERERLQAFTLKQLETITKKREELVLRRNKVEQELALREQQVNRQAKLVADRTRAIDERERKLSQAEERWHAEQERLNKIEQTARRLEATKTRLQREIEKQRTTLESLRLQIPQFEERARSAEAEMRAFENRLQQQKESAAKFDVKQEQIDKRFKSIEDADRALQQREMELDELEAKLRCEIEQREQELVRQSREFEEMQANARKKRMAGDDSHGVLLGEDAQVLYRLL